MSEEPISELLNRLRSRGAALSLSDDQIRVMGASAECAKDLAHLRSRKPEALLYLQQVDAAGGSSAETAVQAEDAIVESRKDHPFASSPPGGFETMLAVDRYGARTVLFDRMITASEDHFWSPLDPRYLDFSAPFDMGAEALIDDGEFLCLRTPSVMARFSDPADRIRFLNKIAWVRFSNLLHGEQGAFNLSASLCGVLQDQGAQEFAANQTREEARHVSAFSRYVKARFGRPAPCPPVLKDFLIEIISSSDTTKKIVGMQIMVEGLAMGALSSLYKKVRDPLGRRLLQLVMTDEAMHHRFGKLWADKTMPGLTPSEQTRLEAWTAHCLRDFVVKMNPPLELHILKQDFGLDPVQVTAEIQALPQPLKDAATPLGTPEVFRVLTNILLGAGLLSDDAKALYQTYLSADDLADATRLQEDIVEDGRTYLKAINQPSAVPA